MYCKIIYSYYSEKFTDIISFKKILLKILITMKSRKIKQC